MSMSDWAKEEVRLACKKEAPDRKDGEWDYGCACHESALKAYLSLMEDEHSGASFGFTANILKRLLESKPLTPIVDTPEVWDDIISRGEDGSITYQCKRMSSLFKTVHPDGTVSYSDVDRYYCIDDSTGSTYTSGLESRLLDAWYPITMPYYPPLGYYVFETCELLEDVKTITTLKTPDGHRELVQKYYANTEDGWREISLFECKNMLEAHRKLETEARKKEE
jgi:hypothetical protein